MSERRSELKAVSSGDGMAAAKTAERDAMKAASLMWEGWTEVNTKMMALAQNAMRNNMSAAEELRQCQSPRDMMECQIRLARQSMDEYMDGARQIGEVMVKVSADAMGCMGMPR